ncbi:hypothetical protein CK203_085582 [Vitis vinifera]|uniref:Uncharacterized protein n=1 Tax=Vitis vinifera TaxID=29760 RepID=A0A438BWD8_VITVI|nr:hypothetical protein CK203_085582 [Vitis vinifera]
MCWSVYLCITFYFSMPNDAVIILTMAGNGLDGSAASSLPLSGSNGLRYTAMGIGKNHVLYDGRRVEEGIKRGVLVGMVMGMGLTL